MSGYIARLKGLSNAARELEIDGKISETYNKITDSDLMNSMIAETNASGWGIDTHELVDEPEFDGKECFVSIEFEASGDQEEEKGLLGDQITGKATAIIDDDGVVRYEDIEAHLNFP